MTTKRPFVISRGATTSFENLVFELHRGDHVGWGEACPGRSVTGEDREAAASALAAWTRDPAALEAFALKAEFAVGGHATPAAKSAALCAYLDVLGREKGRSVASLLNLPSGERRSSITLSLGPPAAVLDEAEGRAAEGWAIFKVKLGGEHDEAVVEALRDRFPDKALRVDANEAWTPAVARARLAFLERHEVEFVEQPLRRDLLDETAELARAFEIPIVLDEPLKDAQDAVGLVTREVADGGNVKLAKCGGPFEARRVVKILRDHGWRVMMGCNLESRLGNAAAAAFAGTLDWADIDSHELLADDPWTGFATPAGRLTTPAGPGLGVDLTDRSRLRPIERASAGAKRTAL